MRRLHRAFILSIFTGGPALAQISYPNCSAGWEWSYNSINQNPCDVAAYMESSCNGGQFNIAALPSGRQYAGPSSSQHYPCQCNTVVYSLVSACGACQESSWILWSAWSSSCPNVTASTYPKSIPGGTRVPHWAYIDVTTADNWNPAAAQSAGDSPEATPNAVSTIQASSTTASSATQGSSNQNHPVSHAGPIAGSVVGGVIGVALLTALILWYRRRRLLHARSQASRFTENEDVFGFSNPDTSMSTGKYYDPSDPSTFPKPFVSPSASVLQTTASTDQVDSSGSIRPSDRTRYTGLPLV